MTDLAAVIAWVESKGNARRLRREPLLLAAWDKEMTAERIVIRELIIGAHGGPAGCSHATAVMLACCSWGRYQILGMNLWAPPAPISADIFEYAADFDLQLRSFNRFIERAGVAFTLEEIVADQAKRIRFISRYNGPADPAGYWEAMQEAITALNGSGTA